MLKLSPRMEEILLLASGKRMREVEIAEELGISKQAVSKALRESRARLTQIFLAVAEVLNSDIIRINVEKGFIVLRNRQTRAKLYVLYAPGKGPRVFLAENLGADKSYCEKLIDAAVKWGLIEQDDIRGELDEVMKNLISRMEG